MAAGGALAAALLWSFWPTLQEMAHRWTNDPQYSHGYVVPVLALVLLWVRREGRPPAVLRPSWWGTAFLGGAALLCLVGAGLNYATLDQLALLVCVAGSCLLLGGWPALRWAWPAVVFLVFMLPLPYSLETALSLPLRHLATGASTYALQTLGFPAVAEGNVILIGDLKLGVLEACSGLSMLLTFFALSAFVTLLVRRPLATQAVIFLSAAPIGVLMNVARITATAALARLVSSAAANVLFHDLAGWVMMPLALGLLWLEVRLLDRLFVAPEGTGPVPLFKGS
ncbi:MAG TPA: exosortase/archaeosortase family protein [Gemmataceae bacterium]|nr:exosortase/archaeosortase family protein [Gemmataceae bacterium]